MWVSTPAGERPWGLRVGDGTLRRSGSGLGRPFLAFLTQRLTQEGCGGVGRLLSLRRGCAQDAARSRLALVLQTEVRPGAKLWARGLVAGPQLPFRGRPPPSFSVSATKSGRATSL